MGSKAKSKARNKAKRSGVPNAKTAASSAAAAAASHVAADIQIEHAGVGQLGAPSMAAAEALQSSSAETTQPSESRSSAAKTASSPDSLGDEAGSVALAASTETAGLASPSSIPTKPDALGHSDKFEQTEAVPETPERNVSVSQSVQEGTAHAALPNAHARETGTDDENALKANDQQEEDVSAGTALASATPAPIVNASEPVSPKSEKPEPLAGTANTAIKRTGATGIHEPHFSGVASSRISDLKTPASNEALPEEDEFLKSISAAGQEVKLSAKPLADTQILVHDNGEESPKHRESGRASNKPEHSEDSQPIGSNVRSRSDEADAVLATKLAAEVDRVPDIGRSVSPLETPSLNEAPAADSPAPLSSGNHAADEPAAPPLGSSQDYNLNKILDPQRSALGPTEDEFFKSISAAGREAKRSDKSLEEKRIVVVNENGEECSRRSENIGHNTGSDAQVHDQQHSWKPEESDRSLDRREYWQEGGEQDEVDGNIQLTGGRECSPDSREPSNEAELLTKEIEKCDQTDRLLSPDQIAPEEEGATQASPTNEKLESAVTSGPEQTPQRDVHPGSYDLNALLDSGGTEGHEDDEFYRSISAAGHEAQTSGAGLHRSQQISDEAELEAEVKHDREQESAFDKMIGVRRSREAEIKEECNALENHNDALSNGVLQAAADDIEAREAQAEARYEAQESARLAGDDLQPKKSGSPPPDDEDDFYGALNNKQSGQSDAIPHSASRSDSGIAPDEFPAENMNSEVPALNYSRSDSNIAPDELPVGNDFALETSKLQPLDGDDFFRSLSTVSRGSGSSSGRLETEDYAEERVNSDFDGTLGKSELLRGGSSSVSSSPITQAMGEFDEAPPLPALNQGSLNLELDDDFLDDDEEEQPISDVLQTQSSHAPAASLSFLDIDDDLLPDEEDSLTQDQAMSTTASVGPSMSAESGETTMPSIKPRPSMTEFHTDRQGFDLPLEILQQPKRHAAQRVGSRVGTPQNVASPRGPPPQMSPHVGTRGQASLPVSPPRASAAPPPLRAAPARAPSRFHSGGPGTSKYTPTGSSVPPGQMLPPQHHQAATQPHNMFVNQATDAHQGSRTTQFRTGQTATQVPPPAQQTVAPRPAPNPDPYGFPGLVAPPAARRMSSRPPSAAPRRAGGAASAPSVQSGLGNESPGLSAPLQTGRTTPQMSAPPRGPVPGATTPSHLSPRENISPRTVARSKISPHSVPPSSVPHASAPHLSPKANLNGQRDSQFGASLSSLNAAPPQAAAPLGDPRTRYTPSPLNMPVSVGPPRGNCPEDQLLKRQRELFVWSAHSWVHVSTEAQFGATSASVVTGELRRLSLLPEEALAKFPLPLFNTKGPMKTKRKELEKWVEERSAALEGQPGALLYAIFKHMLGPDENRDKGLRELLKSYAVPAPSSKRSEENAVLRSTSAASEVLGLLRDGDRVGAMQKALDSRDYAHAFILAHALGGNNWQVALNEFVAEEVRRQDPQLAFVYRALGAGDAAAGAAAISELKPRGETAHVDFAGLDKNLERWADAAAALYEGGGAANAALAELAALLVDRGRVEEGHACFVLAGIMPGAPGFRLPLLGAHGAPSFDSLVLNEVYEFVAGRITPAMLPSKIELAGLLADSGYRPDALRIAENNTALLKAHKAPPMLNEQASRMVSRCSPISQAQGTWLQRKLSRPNLEKNWMSSFNKFVSGDEEVEPPRPQSAGMPVVTEAIPQRQSHTPGPYSMRSDAAAYSISGALSNADQNMNWSSTRPAPIGEVNEEYAPFGGGIPSQNAPQYQPHYQLNHVAQVKPGPSPGGQSAYMPQPQTGLYMPSSAPFSSQGSTPAPAPPHGVHPSTGAPHAAVPLQAAAPLDPYAPNVVGLEAPNDIYASRSAGGQYAPHVAQPVDAYIQRGMASGGPYAPQLTQPGGPYGFQVGQPGMSAPHAGQSGGPYAPQVAQPGGHLTPHNALPEDSYAQKPGDQYMTGAPLQQAAGPTAAPEGRIDSKDFASSESSSVTTATVEPKKQPNSTDAAKDEQPKKKGWLSWLKKEDPNSQKPIPVKLGSEAKVVYDKELKRWVKEGEPRPEPTRGPPPPPKARTMTPSAPEPPMLAPSQGQGPAPPLGVSPPAVAPAGVPPVVAPPGAAFVPLSADSNPVPPSVGSGPPTAKQTPSVRPAASGIDDILAASASAGGRKKRPGRSRYVSTTESGMPQGMAPP